MKFIQGSPNEHRKVRKFLFFPLTLSRPSGIYETRWLEFAWIEQMYKSQGIFTHEHRWENIAWAGPYGVP